VIIAEKKRSLDIKKSDSWTRPAFSEKRHSPTPPSRFVFFLISLRIQLILFNGPPHVCPYAKIPDYPNR